METLHACLLRFSTLRNFLFPLHLCFLGERLSCKRPSSRNIVNSLSSYLLSYIFTHLIRHPEIQESIRRLEIEQFSTFQNCQKIWDIKRKLNAFVLCALSSIYNVMFPKRSVHYIVVILPKLVNSIIDKSLQNQFISSLKIALNIP